MAVDSGGGGGNGPLRAAWPEVDLSKLAQVKLKEYAARFVLGALVSIVAALIAKGAGPRFGGMFLAFPAILPASLTLVQAEEGTRKADRDAIGAVLGGLGLAVFAGVAEKALFSLPAIVALLIALASWLVSSVALYVLLAIVRPDDCDKDKD